MDLAEDATHASESGKRNKSMRNSNSFAIKGGASKGGKMTQKTINEIMKDRDAACMDILSHSVCSGSAVQSSEKSFIYENDKIRSKLKKRT